MQNTASSPSVYFYSQFMALRLDSVTGLIGGVRQIPSPNWDERPRNAAIDVLVIHAISLPPGQFGGDGIEALFCNRLDPAVHPYYRRIAGLRLSAHLLIRRDGEVIQFVALSKRAWHAGESWYGGRPQVNDFSIGIELEGADDQPFEPSQYRRLVDLSGLLIRAYPGITVDRIVGHSTIAPGRKTDPGPGFDWDQYRRLLHACLAGLHGTT